MSQPTHKRPALGRGLGALLPASPSPAVQRGLITVNIDAVHPERRQPRRHFDQTALNELAQSIRSIGLIQPLLVRRVPDGDYVIIAGERRWRAAREAGLDEVPIIVKEVSEVEAFEVALIENIQRQDLNPIEEADAYHRLVEEFGLTQENLAVRVGRDRSTIANSLRLRRLPPSLKDQVAEGSLSVGHAKVVLGLDDPETMEQVAQTIVAKQLSVRASEQLVARLKAPPEDPPEKPEPPGSVQKLVSRVTRRLKHPVEVAMRSDEKGSIVLKFTSRSEAEALLKVLLAGAATMEGDET